jgi:glycosyltransferase involved in cell wall biosynthesis
LKNTVSLSFVIVTRNKLPYLKLVLEKLLSNIQTDEELIVIDGASTDGTVEYVESFYKDGLINVFISEPDKGEAHGCNKGILLASGEIVKLISDDDVFDYEIIKRCKEYLIGNPLVDILFANTASINSTLPFSDLVLAKNYEAWFENWMNELTPNCFICCLSLFVRKKSFTYIGLFDTSFKHTDLEFSVRATSKKINAAFCTGLLVCANINSNSISNISGDVVSKEIKRVTSNYGYTYPVGLIQRQDEGKYNSPIKRIINRVFRKNEKKRDFYPDYNFVLEKNIDTSNIASLNETLLHVMCNYNKNNPIKFLEKIIHN